MKNRVSLVCAMVALSALLPATAGLQIRSRPADVVSTVRSPVKVTTLANGHTLVDFGKDAAGYVQFDAKGAGAYEMIIGEALDSSGAVNNTAHAGMYNCWYSYVTDKNNKKVECSLRAVTLSGSVSAAGTFRVPMALPWQKRFDGNAHVKTAAGDEVCPFRYIEVISLPSGVSAADLRQVMYHYPFDYDDSSFTSSDANLNQVYDLCKWSLYADSYLGYWLDGDRERQFYQADAYVSILDSLGVFSDMTMNKRTAKEFFVDEWKHEWSVEWYLYTFLTAFQDYWHSGDISTLQAYYDHIKPTATTGKFYKIPSQYQQENGLLASPKDGWESSIIDWPQMYRYDYDMGKSGTNGSDNDDGRLMPIENALLCQQYRDLATTATALGKTADAAQWSAMATKIYNAYQEVFFDASCGLYRDKAKTDGYRSTKHSIQANAAALAFGMVPADKIATVAEFVANEGMKCGTYMAHLVLEGLGRAGRADAAIAYMASTAENSWMNMINEGLTTCCETWSIASGGGVVGGAPDVNHPWSCAPASIVSRYVLGVRPAAAGWAKATVAPQFGSLTQVRGKVPTAKGPVEVEYANSQLTVTVPAGLAADVTFAGQTKTVAANAATRTVTITEGGSTHTHSYGGYTETTPATCTTKGVETATCACGASVTREIAALGHDWSGTWQVVTAATETTPGEKRLVCARAGCEVYQTQIIPATGGDVPGGDVPPGSVSAKAAWTRTAVKTTSFVPSADNLLTDARVRTSVTNNKEGDDYMSQSDIAATSDYMQIPINQIFGTGWSVKFAGADGLTDGKVGATSTQRDYTQYFLNRDPYPNAAGLYPCNVQTWSACLINNGAVCTFELPEAAYLTKLVIYGYWKDNGRNRPAVASVAVRARGSDDWRTIPNTAYAVSAATTDMNCITLSSTDGWLATDVTAIRITVGTQTNGCTGYTEIEACGSYTGTTSGQTQNAWTVEPSVPATFEEGTTPSLSLGTPVAGAPSANYTAAQLAQLKPGAYTLDVRVDASSSATALRKLIDFTVTNREVSPEAATGEYLWTKQTGKFDDAANWSGVYNGTKPHLATDSVKIANTKNQNVVIDLDGKELTAGKLLYNAAQRGVTIKNGTLHVENVEQTCKANLTFEDVTLVGTGSGTIRSLMNFTRPTFVGTCNLQGIAIRCEKGSSGAVFRNGTTTFDRDFSYSKNGGNADILTVENARVIGTAIAPTAEKHTITFTLGENNADGKPMVKLSGAFGIVSGSTLTVDAGKMMPGTYRLVEAASVADSGNVTGSAKITCGAGLTASLSRTATAIDLVIEGSPLPPADEWGYSNKVTVAGKDYMTVVFTKTSEAVSWRVPSNVTKIDYLVVGGGASGGSSNNGYSGGGGGAGGVVEDSMTVVGGAEVTAIVGAGGASVKGSAGEDGKASSLSVGGAVVASALPGAGGGGGASNGRGDATKYACGGGAGGGYESQGTKTGGAGAVSKGGDADPGKGAGGGGAGGDGVAGSSGGAGGAGVTTAIFDGKNYDIAGGGCGSSYGNKGRTTTFGGGATATDAARWGAGGGGAGGTGVSSGAGYQGVVVIRYELDGGDDPTTPGTDPIPVALPTAQTDLVYTGAEQTGVASGTGYAVSGNTGTDAGGYTASVTLADGYVWSDGNTSKTRTVAWSIAKGVNSWTTQPSVSPTTWAEDAVPATIVISNGANTFGATVTCDTTEAELKALGDGTAKTVTFTAAGCANYDAITHQVLVMVRAATAGRTFGSVTIKGDEAALAFGEAKNDLQLWVAWGDSDGGTVLANWEHVEYVGLLRKGETEKTAKIPGEARFVRFFTRSAYDKTLTALVGNRGSNASVGPYFNTGDTPLYSDSIEAEITPPNLTDANYDAVFSSRKDNNSGDKTMTVFLVGQNVNDNSTKGRVRFDFGPYTGTATPSQCSKTTWSHGQRINIALANGQPMINGDAATDRGFTVHEGSPNGPMLLFACPTPGTPNHVGRFKLHSFDWSDMDGVAKHHYIPVQSQGLNTLYDTVTGELLTPSKVGDEAGDFSSEGESTSERLQTPLTWSEVFEATVTPPESEPPDYEWGYSNTVTISGCDYAVLVFTNTAETISWEVPQGVTAIDYLVVGGGGAGGSSGNNNGGGGGGAGGVRQATGVAVTGGEQVKVAVGAGGQGVTSGTVQGASGTGSSLAFGETFVSALPGAGGSKGAFNGSGSADTCACGGGGGGGTAGQGNKSGGAGVVSRGGVGYDGAGGGGGGAGGDGVDSANGGTGGTGVATTIFDGTELRIAGGGSGAPSGRGGNPSVDGGGAGGHRHVSYGGENATSGTTWGAGGGGGKNASPSGSGHQGVVVIRYELVEGGDEPSARKPNRWTTDPSVSVTTWVENGTAGVLNMGAALFGEVTCDYTQEQLNTLKPGSYKITFSVAGTDEYTGLLAFVTVVVEEKPVLGAAAWTAYMQGVDTAEELAAVKARVAGKPKVKIAFANSSTDRTYGTPHDDFEQKEMYKQAEYFGLDIEIVRIQPVDLANGRTLGVVYQEAVDRADIVCDFSSYWDDSRDLAANVIAANPDRLFILPYGEIGNCPPTGTSLQGMAQHHDGTGYKNMILTSPIGPTTGGALTGVSRRTEGDTETITFVVPSGWAAGLGDTCRSASMAGVLAAWIWAAHGDSPTAAEIVKLLTDASSLPEPSDVTGFTAAQIETLKANLADYVAVDDLGRSKLICGKPVNMANILPLLSEPGEDPEPQHTDVPLELSKIFQSQMVLQRDRPVRVWGKGPMGKTVTVSFGGETATSAAIGEDDIWEVTFEKTFSASATGRTLTATCSDGTSVSIDDVLVGDVWIAAGQSNMVMPVKGSAYGDTYDADATVADMANHPQIRWMAMGVDYNNAPTPEPYEVKGGAWGKAAGNLSAVAYHFAHDCVTAHPDIPVGIVGAYCNALSIGYWTPGGSKTLWNCQLAPITRLAVRGALWYQGETDANGTEIRDHRWYGRDLLKPMVEAWRKAFGVEAADFPFYFVQIAGNNNASTFDDPSGDADNAYRAVRESLFWARRNIENCGMAVAWDCGRRMLDSEVGTSRIGEIVVHPKCKNVLGKRLALLALRNVYGDNVVAESPYWTETVTDGKGNIRVKFDMNGSAGLTTALKNWDDAAWPVKTTGEPLKGFAIAGSDKKWSWADAVIESADTVRLSSPDVAEPLYVRYCYRCNPVGGIANGYNEEMLPIAPIATEYSWYADVRKEGGEDPEPPTPVTGEDWGWAKTQEVDGVRYAIVAFTNTEREISWPIPSDVSTVDYVVVAGGGGGGAGNGYSTIRGGGGGGAGGLLHGTQEGAGQLSVSVGKGGAAGKNGFDSTLVFGGVTLTAVGGGAGAHDNDNGAAGGSGGGGGGKNWKSLGGAGFEGQGQAGGGGGGGGGGYAAAGTGGKAGAGGAGYEDPISGLTLAAGGRGGTPEGEDGNRNGASGLASTGNGGEGAFGLGKTAGAGGSGIVIVRYAIGGDEPIPEQPTVDGKSVAFDQDTFAALVSTSDIVFPAEPALEKSADGTVVTFAGKNVTIKDCYKVEVVSTEGGFRMTLALDPEVVTPVIEGEEEKEAFVLTDEAVSIHITNARSDLWYALETADALGPAAEWTVDSSTWTQGGDLTAAKTDDAARFYRVIVRDVR